jgi:hypothetical protein
MRGQANLQYIYTAREQRFADGIHKVGHDLSSLSEDIITSREVVGEVRAGALKGSIY